MENNIIASLDSEQQTRLDSHIDELKKSDLRGLEGRIQRGLDPAGMLAINEIRTVISRILDTAGIDIAKLDTLTKELHVGAIWSNADDLSKAEKPEIKAWMLLASECREANGVELTPSQYLSDTDRIKNDLLHAEQDPETALANAVQKMVGKARNNFEIRDGVPYSEVDGFLYMALCGEKFGVCKSGELYFAGADQLDFTVLEQDGLMPIEKEDRGRVATFYQKDGKDVVKKLYPGLAIVYGDEALARRLAKSAEKFIGK